MLFAGYSPALAASMTCLSRSVALTLMLAKGRCLDMAITRE